MAMAWGTFARTSTCERGRGEDANDLRGKAGQIVQFAVEDMLKNLILLLFGHRHGLGHGDV